MKMVFICLHFFVFLFLEQHKIGAKGEQHMQAVSSTKFLKFWWDGHFNFICDPYLCLSNPIFLWKPILIECWEKQVKPIWDDDTWDDDKQTCAKQVKLAWDDDTWGNDKQAKMWDVDTQMNGWDEGKQTKQSRNCQLEESW